MIHSHEQGQDLNTYEHMMLEDWTLVAEHQASVSSIAAAVCLEFAMILDYAQPS